MQLRKHPGWALLAEKASQQIAARKGEQTGAMLGVEDVLKYNYVEGEIAGLEWWEGYVNIMCESELLAELTEELENERAKQPDDE